MDGYSLTAKMRKIRRRFRLTATEQALYQELISICNEEGWSEIFRVANNELFIALNITEKTLIKARESLINSELIFYKSGKSKRSVGSYSFTKTFETAVKITVDDIGNSIDNNSDLIKTKTKKETKIFNNNFFIGKGGDNEINKRQHELERIYREELRGAN